jgi:hypothetical protein
MRCGGRASASRLACSPWRVVEAQHLLSSRKLVDSQEEYDLLERLIDDSKPPLPGGREFAGLHHLLSTPFRYPPLRHGSRFGRRTERSLWYGAEALETAFAEHAYYRLLLFEGTSAALAPNTITASAFQARVETARGVDLGAPPFDAHRRAIASPISYDATQQLGAEMRGDGVEAFRYPSARCPRGGANVGLFTPAAFAARSPKKLQNWFCTVTAQRGVEYRRQDVGTVLQVDFRRASFLVGGALPRPAT